MKRTILRTWMMAAIFAGTGCGLVACDDDNNEGGNFPPSDPDVTAVVGEYAGTMSVDEVAPADAEGEEPVGAPLDVQVTGDEIRFTDFPIRDLVVRVVGEENADAVVALVGPVDYAFSYTALMSGDEAAVDLTLTPEPLKLTLDDGGEGETSELADPVEVEVTITVQKEGVYTLGSTALNFRLSAAGVKIGGAELPAFKPFTLGFDLVKR